MPSGSGICPGWTTSTCGDGIHVNIRLEEHKLCLPVMIGVRADGRKELVALADGYRESVESWADLLRDAARRGVRAPVLAVGDGALGFWGALREVFPQTRAQRCWFHKIANVLKALRHGAHPGAKRHSRRSGIEDKRHALDAVSRFMAAYGASFPKRSRRSPTISTSCSPSMTTPPSTGFICARRIPSGLFSPRSGTEARSPRGRARERLGWRRRSNSSKPRRPAGEPSTHPTWSPSSAPDPCSRPASS